MSALKLLPLAAVAAATLAISPAAAKAPRGEAFRELSDPRTQQAMGDMLGDLFGVLLSMPADPLARAMDAAGDHDAARRIPHGTTLGDLAGPEARNAPREIRRRAPALIGAMGELAGTLEEMAPEFERIADDFGRKMESRSRN